MLGSNALRRALTILGNGNTNNRADDQPQLRPTAPFQVGVIKQRVRRQLAPGVFLGSPVARHTPQRTSQADRLLDAVQAESPVHEFTDDDWEALQLRIALEESRAIAQTAASESSQRQGGTESPRASTSARPHARALTEPAVSVDAKTRATFECGICLDNPVVMDIAKVQPCHHEFCRDCLRSYILNQIGDRRFPIVCPLCSAERGVAQPGEINETLIAILGIPDSEYAIYEELQLSAFSVQVYCRGCNKTINMDRQGFNETRILDCPLPRCRYKWCKSCNQELKKNESQCNACDGTTEFDRMVRRCGWKRCPGCSAAVQKNEGCNHVTCVTPGCNTHFCYTCGKLIVRSRTVNDVASEAIRRHYSGLFSCRQH